MEFFEDRLLHTDWCHSVVNMPGVVLAVSSVRVCQPTLTCFLTFPNVFQVFACCAEDKLSLSFSKTTFVYLFPFCLHFFLWFSLLWLKKKKAQSTKLTPLPSHNINTSHQSCLINHKVFLLYQWSLVQNAHLPPSELWLWTGQHTEPLGISCYSHSFLHFPPDEDLFPLEWTFLRENLPLSELSAMCARDLNR